MTPEEANATVEAAIAKGTAKYGGMAAKVSALAAEARNEDEFQNLALIYMAELTDWTVQVAHLVGDHRWESCVSALPVMRIAIDKLAGAVNNIMLSQQSALKKVADIISHDPYKIHHPQDQ
jgi:hypothetical protein